MAEPASPRQPAEHDRDAAASNDHEYARLRELLVGPEREQLDQLQQRVSDAEIRAEDVGEVLAEAVALGGKRDARLRKSLQPLFEEALRISVRSNPNVVADALYPSIGAAVRKSVASALAGMIQSMNLVMEKSLSWRSLRWRWEAARTGRSFGEVALLRSVLYRVEQVFLIHRRTGLLLQHVSLASVVKDADLVSGMLSAINDFVRDSFGGGEENQLETVEVGAYRIWIVHGPSAVLAGVISGNPPRELGNVLERALEEIHRDQRAGLESFEGDRSALAATRPRLEECLQGAGDAKTRRVSPLVWVVVAAVLVAGIWALMGWLRETRRWETYLASLRDEPGIVVTSAGSSGGSYHVAGLRDPLSSDPIGLADAAGLDTDDLRFAWEPYHSSHPAFAAVRELELRTRLVEEQRVHFSTNSGEISVDQLDTISATVVRMKALLTAAAAAGSEVRIEVSGGADPSGASDRNRELAETRARSLRALLIERGIEPSRLVLADLKSEQTSQQGDTDLERAFARVVSFRVLRSQP